jgi:hypothetical protein
MITGAVIAAPLGTLKQERGAVTRLADTGDAEDVYGSQADNVWNRLSDMARFRELVGRALEGRFVRIGVHLFY